MSDQLNDILKKLTFLVEEEEKRKNYKQEKKDSENNFLDKEEPGLIRRSWQIFIILSCLTSISGVLIILDETKVIYIDLIWKCVIAGVLGSSTSALISVLDRKSKGWESKNGDKYPEYGKPERFTIRMSTFFIFRPVFGILAGLLVFYGIYSNYVANIDGPEKEMKIIFISFLAGLFIKSLIQKLKDLFDSLVGK